MASTYSRAVSFQALLTILNILAVSTAEPIPQEWIESFEDEATCFMQSQAALLNSGPRQLLAQAASGTFDSTVFAQTVLEVSSSAASAQEVADQNSNAGDVEPAWLADGKHAETQSDEETTCSLEGLTPGVCAIAALARPVAVSNGKAGLDYINPDRLERALFQEIEAALAGNHSGFSAAHASGIEEELSGFFASLPKNEAGRLDHAAVRYALHQRFLRKHAWYIRSLNPVGEAQAPASPGEALRGQVPEHLQKLIEQREGGRGLGLRELAALVATLEHLIEGDTAERLKATYSAHGLVPSRAVGREGAADALKTYMAHFLSLEHRSGYTFTPEQARQERKSIEAGYGAWPSVVAMIDEAVASRLPESPEAPLPFGEALSAAKEVMSKFELVSVQDCQDIKRNLTTMPNGAMGRVLLADLHRKAVDGSMLFAESKEYLSTLGALDELHGAVAVLVPNYVYSPSNCLGTTSFFDMCCPNECEVVMEELETRLRKPSATPAEVKAVIDLIRAEGPLSEASMQELEFLAGARGGRLPLHGHGFAAWLHGAFPQECPKPGLEDFAGARHEAEVPAAQQEYQAVAKLPSIVASKSDLIAELEEEERQDAADPKVSGGNGVDLDIDQLKALAADKLGVKGLKVASLFDASSLAQTGLDAMPGAASAEESAEESVSVEETPKASGLNIRQEV